MRHNTRVWTALFFAFAALAWTGTAPPLLAQNIQVTSANPPAAAQGTINLNVVIGGNGFKRGATAQWFVTGTTNPGGVTVNSTAFNSQTQLTANITIADTADISNYDVVVYSSGRTGKGTGLFSVTQKGTPTGCTTLGTPSGFGLATTFNYTNSSGAAQYAAGLGTAIQARPATLTAGGVSRTVIVVAAGSGVANGQAGKLEIFFLDPATGQVLDGSVIVGTQVQPHITVNYDPTNTIGFRTMAAGDVNGDGIPDFAGGLRTNNVAYAFVSSVDANGILSYSFTPLNPPASDPGFFGTALAMGKLDGGSAGDQLVVGAPGGGNGKNVSPGEVYAYSYNGSGFDLIATLNDPANTAESFGGGLAIADVTGDGAPDLIVGAHGASVNGISGTGVVYVFPSPLASLTYYTLSTAIKNDNVGFRLGVGSIDGHLDVIASANSPAGVVLFDGPVAANQTSPSLRLMSDPRLTTTGWASTNADSGDLLGTGQGAFIVGDPNADTTTSCSVSVGAAELYLPTSVNLSAPSFSFEPPTVQSAYMGFGWGVAIVPAVSGVTNFTPLLIVGESGRQVGTTSSAGQVYVYKMN